MMIVGIMIMFLAPFGMLVAKWATLVSFVDTRQFALLLMLAFGSAATFMFWANVAWKVSWNLQALPRVLKDGTLERVGCNNDVYHSRACLLCGNSAYV